MANGDEGGATTPDLKRLVAWVNRGLSTSIGMFLAVLLVAMWHLVANRAAVEILPLANHGGGDQVAVALQVSEKLAAIAGGSTSGLDPDECIQQAAIAPPPSVTIPGTSVPLETVLEVLEVGWLGRQDRVRVALESDATHHRLRVQVDGWNLSGRTVVTEDKATDAEAILDGAEQIFATLRPASAAAYFATRYPERSLALVVPVLQDPTSPPAWQATAYRVWALLLRDQGDVDGALDKLWRAFQLAPPGVQRASILVDTGDVLGVSGRWTDAARAFRDAIGEAPASKISKSRLAFALMEEGALREAASTFEELKDPLWLEPYRGLAETARREWDVWRARDYYRQAFGAAFSPGDRALVAREIGDLYVGIGCMKEGQSFYRQAATLEQQAALSGACYTGPGAEPRCRGVFGDYDRSCAFLGLAPAPGA